MIKTKDQLLEDSVHEFTYEVNEHGHVLEVMTRRSDGHRVSESMVYGLDTDSPYTRWHGGRYFLTEEGAREAREARRTYREWLSGHGSDPRWGWEVIDA